MRQLHYYLPFVATALAATAVGIAIGVYGQPLISHDVDPGDIRELGGHYRLVSPLLSCGTDEDLQVGEAKKLDDELTQYVNTEKANGTLDDASIYFRDLNGGPWVGVNYQSPYVPASLLKVPLAMSVYKKAEADSTFLTQKIHYTGTETTNDQHFAAPMLAPGDYTVEELVHQTLINSDNDAANLLAQAVGEQGFKQTYADLGVTEPPTEGAGYTTDPHDFASFFRVLYNATYLSSDYSEHILELMTSTAFKAGLVAGVPEGVTVAHKFGEHSVDGSMSVQLNDCGIIYATSHPYILCVMTQGTDFDQLAAAIAHISQVTYSYVSSGK